jgi:hypothetical protein
MSLQAIIKELRDELDTVNQAIAGLERLTAGQLQNGTRLQARTKRLPGKANRGESPESGRAAGCHPAPALIL